jgi:hypothetical protein
MATQVARRCRNTPLWPAYAGLSVDIMLPKIERQKDECRMKKPCRVTLLFVFYILHSSFCLLKWNPVLELHQPLRLCRPPPELIGQRDNRFGEPALHSSDDVDGQVKFAIRDVVGLDRCRECDQPPDCYRLETNPTKRRTAASSSTLEPDAKHPVHPGSLYPGRTHTSVSPAFCCLLAAS